MPRRFGIDADNIDVSLARQESSKGAVHLDGEAGRLAALERYAIVDTPPESEFDRIIEVAARALRVPWAAITFVDASRVWRKASFPLEQVRQGARELSFCGHVIAGPDDVTIVPDAQADPRFCRFPSVVAGVRFYAGAPLVTPDGHRIGTVCVLDSVPRSLDPEQIECMRALAAMTMDQLEVRLKLARANGLSTQLATVIKSSPMAVVTCDLDLRVTSWSPVAERISGWSEAELVGKFTPTFPNGHDHQFDDLLAAIKRGETVLSSRAKIKCKDGTSVDVCWSSAPLYAPDGSVSGFVSVGEDLNAIERAERHVRVLESVVISSNDAVIVTTSEPDDEPEIVYVNEAFTRLYGYAASETVGMTAALLRGSDPDPLVRARIREARRRRAPLVIETLEQRKNGETFWCELNLSPVIGPDGRAEHWVIFARDITARRRAERLQLDRGHILEMIAADAPLEQILQELVATAERARPGAHAAIEVHGAAIADGGSLIVGNPPENDAASPEVLWESLIGATDIGVRGTFSFRAAGDAPPTNADLRLCGEFAHLAGIAIERQHDRERLEFLALHDGLTNLPNRVLFEQRVREAIKEAAASHTKLAVGIIDLDRFKQINDSLGHATGDQLLREVASRLKSGTRPSDMVARMGGDEFVFLLTNLGGKEEAKAVADRFMSSLGSSFDCGGQEVYMRASMGVCFYPDDAVEPDQLFALSDAAMYRGKTQGRDIAFHERSAIGDGIGRISFETHLIRALENRELEVMYQPIVDLRTRSYAGAEALLRWNHPDLGRLLPEAFLGIAEDIGLIVPFGAWVIEEACRFAKRWQDEGSERFVSVNVSARQFDDPDFAGVVTSTLARTQLDPNRLHLELTESLVMRSPEAAALTLAELKRTGVKIVIDDFGNGYSSFNYLKRFPLDMIKIDHLFVRDIGRGPQSRNDEAIVRAIVTVARALDLTIVTEGIEREDQVTFLRAAGIELAQGFLFSKPLVAQEALVWQSDRRISGHP